MRLKLDFHGLTNLDISQQYRDEEFYFMRSSFTGAFAYWVVRQSPFETPDIRFALVAFSNYVNKRVEANIPEKFTYDELSDFINVDIFESIPEIEKLNHPLISSGAEYENRIYTPKPEFDFIDLYALARNVFFMLLRETIMD